MAENKELPSFGWLVIARAWQGTLDTFETTWRAIVLAVAVIVASLITQFFRHGWDAMKTDILNTFWDSVWPVLAVGGGIFLWNLWIAPAALAYDAAVKAVTEGATLRAPEKPAIPMSAINWGPWKHRAQYSIYEFAKILAKSDPAATALTSEGSSYCRLMLEEVEQKKLKYIVRTAVGYHGKYEITPDYYTEISRGDLLAWAKAKSFPVDHIE